MNARAFTLGAVSALAFGCAALGTSASALGATGSATLGSPSLLAGLPSLCDASYDPYQASTFVLDVCGDKVFPLLSSQVGPDGSTTYTYQVYGDTVTAVEPAANFDPVTATAEELKELALPARPSESDRDEYQSWLSTVGKAKFLTPPAELISVPGVSTGAAANVSEQDTSSGAVYSTDNWSGNIEIGGAGAFDGTGSTYTEPTLDASQCANNSVVYWDGLGGFNNGSQDLGQDGTAANTPGLAQDQAWWEILPEDKYVVAVPGLFATVGQKFFAETSYVFSPTARYQFYMENEYTGAAVPLQVDSSSYDGSSAEQIDERPTVYGALPPLTNYETAYWNSTQLFGATPSSASQVQMKNGSDTLAIATAALFNTSDGESEIPFDDVWLRCT